MKKYICSISLGITALILSIAAIGLICWKVPYIDSLTVIASLMVCEFILRVWRCRKWPNKFVCGCKPVSAESRIEEILVKSIEDKNSELYGHIAGLVDSCLKNIYGDNNYLRTEDFQPMARSYILNDKFMALLTRELENRLGLDRNEAEQTRKPAGDAAQSSACELFAKDSQTGVLSVVDSSYEPGVSIYRLFLPSSDSNEAALDLCLDWEDAKQRIIANGNYFLETVCSVYRESKTPTSVMVLNRGEAKKDSSGEWKVTRKIEVELK